MTEEIIIDGIDVAKCRYFTSEWDFNNCGHICKETECKYKRLWYKKQLKRKEQECELLKEDEKSLLNVIDHLQKQKNEWEEKYNDLGQDFDQLKAENEKLKQTLTEIKEIVKPYQRNIDKTCGHCRRYDTCHACCIDDINCYQYKKPTTPACDKYCELKEFEINNMANQVLQKIS